MVTAMTSELSKSIAQKTELHLQFIVCPHDQIQFFVMFHNFTNTTTMKIPLQASLNVCSELICSEGMAPIRKTQ